MSRLLIPVLLLSMAVAAFGEEPIPPGSDRYIVVLHRNQTGEGASLAKEAETLGAHVEADLGDRMIITASSAAIDELRRHASVKYVQNVEMGAKPDAERPDEIQTMTVSQLPIESHSGQTWTTGDYAYDGAGNISTIASQTTPGTQGWRIYGYDSVARLSKAQIRGVTPTATYEYSYDAYGNRTGSALNGSWTSISVSSATNRLGDATYDVRGNQLSRGATVAAYDGFDMVTSYRFDAANVGTYVYTAGDERIGVLRGTEWTWSLRGDDGLVLRQYRSSSTSPTAAWLWVEDFVYRDGLLVGSERVAEEGGRRHYHLDHLGSPRLVTASNGSLISEHDFLPFGEERTTIAQHQARGFDREEPLRFTGHERDFDITDPNNSSAYIDYMHARYYATKAGRFLSPDPVLGNLLQPQSWNRYTYVLNNPMTFIDPTGMSLAGSYGIAATTKGGQIDCDEKGGTVHCEDSIDVEPDDPWGGGVIRFGSLHDFFKWYAAQTDGLRTLSYISANDLYSNRIALDGAQAFADGVIPFADPFAENEFYDEDELGLEYSRKIGEITRDVEIAIVTSAAVRAGVARGGWLNSNRFLRVGFGKGPGARRVFRISGKVVQWLKESGHIDLWRGGRF